MSCSVGVEVGPESEALAAEVALVRRRAVADPVGSFILVGVRFLQEDDKDTKARLATNRAPG